jgi:hypothetical protein
LPEYLDFPGLIKGIEHVFETTNSENVSSYDTKSYVSSTYQQKNEDRQEQGVFKIRVDLPDKKRCKNMSHPGSGSDPSCMLGIANKETGESEYQSWPDCTLLIYFEGVRQSVETIRSD